MDNNNKNWLKIIMYIIVPIFILFAFSVINFSSESAKQVVSEYEKRKHRAVRDMEFQNYDDLVINNELIDYSMMRDKYNINWFKQNKRRDKVRSINHGMSWVSSYSLFNWTLLNAKVMPAFYDKKNPIPRENPRKMFDRIIVLRKINGEWMIYKDIIDYENNDINFGQLFDKDYFKNKINVYDNFIEQIEI